MSKIALITGASRGIGKALATTYFNNGWQVITFSRTKSDLPPEIKQIQIDLSKTEELSVGFENAFAEVNIGSINRFTLINNAGRLGKISDINNIPLSDIGLSIQLNVTVVMQMSSLFIQKSQEINAIKSIINISSGAAINPYQGWSVYCSSKAAVDMFTKTVALEQESKEFPIKITGIRPGVVATEMQQQIRNTSEKDFRKVAKFKELFHTNKLSQPIYVAVKIYNLEANNLLKSGEIIDLRDV